MITFLMTLFGVTTDILLMVATVVAGIAVLGALAYLPIPSRILSMACAVLLAALGPAYIAGKWKGKADCHEAEVRASLERELANRDNQITSLENHLALRKTLDETEDRQAAELEDTNADLTDDLAAVRAALDAERAKPDPAPPGPDKVVVVDRRCLAGDRAPVLREIGRRRPSPSH